MFGLPHPEMEEEVTAVIVAAPGANPDPESIRTRARKELSSYKVPTRIEVLAEESDVPWLASGKPDKRGLLRGSKTRPREHPSGVIPTF